MNDAPTIERLFAAAIRELTACRWQVWVFLAINVPLGAASLYFENEPQIEIGWGFSVAQRFGDQIGTAFAIMIAVSLATMIAEYWLTCGMMRRTYSPIFNRLLAYLCIYILALVAFVVGLLLLVIPGIILIVRWLPLLPAVIHGKRPATEAFADSWEATRGSGWSIFAILLISLAIAIGVDITLVSGMEALGQAGSALSIAMQAFADGLFSAFFIALAVGAYRLLRPDHSAIEAVFE